MADYRKQPEARDFKERFEFKLTVGENIICQRYFKINNFNPLSFGSYELTDVMRDLAKMIDRDLKDKTQVYMEIMAPSVFNTVDEMEQFFANPCNHKDMRSGHGIVVKSNLEHDYAWKEVRDENGEVVGGFPSPLSFKFDDGEMTKTLSDEDYVEYKLSFLDNGREVCSTVWTGVYPKYIRNSIDLSNKRGKFEKMDVSSLGFDMYLVYRVFSGRYDLVYKIIKDIQVTCSNLDNSWYTLSDSYRLPNGKAKVYKNSVENKTV